MYDDYDSWQAAQAYFDYPDYDEYDQWCWEIETSARAYADDNDVPWLPYVDTTADDDYIPF